EDVATKFFEHFALIAQAMNVKGLWDNEEGFYYDQLRLCDGDRRLPLRVRSMVGLIPLFATQTLGRGTLEALPDFAARFQWFVANKPEYEDVVGNVNVLGEREGRLLSIVSPERLRRILATMLDESEFLSPYGLRALAASHRQQPFAIELGGMTASVDYEPGESTTGLFGGNSNWRGPIWFPVHAL